MTRPKRGVVDGTQLGNDPGTGFEEITCDFHEPDFCGAEKALFR
jgi:rubredoxin